MLPTRAYHQGLLLLSRRATQTSHPPRISATPARRNKTMDCAIAAAVHSKLPSLSPDLMEASASGSLILVAYDMIANSVVHHANPFIHATMHPCNHASINHEWNRYSPVRPILFHPSVGSWVRHALNGSFHWYERVPTFALRHFSGHGLVHASNQKKKNRGKHNRYCDPVLVVLFKSTNLQKAFAKKKPIWFVHSFEFNSILGEETLYRESSCSKKRQAGWIEIGFVRENGWFIRSSSWCERHSQR